MKENYLNLRSVECVLKNCRSYLVFIAFNWQNELRFNSFILLLKWVTMIILHVAFILLINKFKKAINFIERNMALYTVEFIASIEYRLTF